MQIVAINKSRQPQKVWLKFDNGYLLPFRVDDLYHLKIEKFADLPSDRVLKIQSASARFLLTESALRQVAMSPKTPRLLFRKLTGIAGYIGKKYEIPVLVSKNLIPEIITLLEDKGLLSETDYESYLRRRFPGKSTMELNQKLFQAGIKTKIKSNHVEEIRVIKKLISTKYIRLDLSDVNTKTKLMAALYRKGFALDNIKSAIDDCLKTR